MPDKEKADMLIEHLISLYRVQKSLEEKNEVLEYEIRSTEARLKAMGLSDFTDFKPKKRGCRIKDTTIII